jgi:hypothetical protein
MRIRTAAIKIADACGTKHSCPGRWAVIVLILRISSLNGAAQDLRLDINIPKAKIQAHEPVDLTVTLTNNSPKPYFVSGAIDLGAIGLGISMAVTNCKSGKLDPLSFLQDLDWLPMGYPRRIRLRGISLCLAGCCC